MRVSSIGIAILLLVPWIGSLHAGTTGKIAGEVKDAQTGEALIGVNVLVEGTTMGGATSLEGYYVILNLPPGTYTLSASAVGYKKKTVQNVVVSVDLTTTIDFTLSSEVVEVGEEIVITAERPVIKKDLTSSESRVDADQIQTLPISEVTEVLTLQAGITQGSDGAIHIRGGRSSEVAYWVDGVSISDVYDGSQSVQVDPNSIQELQVISGTFNAEYGQAMSGIVNYVTKDGDQAFRGNISAYTGSYWTGDGWDYDGDVQTLTSPTQPLSLIDTSSLFYNLKKFRPLNNRNVEASLSGPLVEGMTFYISGRYFKSDGWLYGQNLFNTLGEVQFQNVNVVIDSVNQVGRITLLDDEVSMNGRERLSGQAKVTAQITGTTKLSLSGNYSRIDFRDYSHDWRFLPTGDVRKFDRAYNLTALWNHTLDASSFYTASLTYVYKSFNEYLYENPYDPGYRYVDPDVSQRNNYEFRVIGMNNHRFERRTESRVAKIDYTDQLTRLHQLKAGLEGRLHRLYLEDYNVTYQEEDNFEPSIPDAYGPLYEEYTEEPIELSAYIQDKLEYERMIVNIGVRVDYFDSKGKVLADPADPNVYLPRKYENQQLTDDERLAKWYRDADATVSVSPRFGISYPITDRGILHFSYGHFLQIPSFIHLYQKPGYKVTTESGVQGVYGNPNLKPQKTVMYEFGLQQQVSDNTSFDVTGFYRDTRDWVTTSTAIPVGDDPDNAVSSYVMYVNRTYANTGGITLSLNKRPVGDIWSINFAYTFQIAEGIASTPDQEFSALVSNSEPPRSLVPLDWDQKHTANLTVGLAEHDWGLFVLGRYGSGLPYTPSLNQTENIGTDASLTVKQNSRRRPDILNFDFRAFKNFSFAGVDLSVFLKVFNVFDRRNEVTVYSETGRATATARSLGAENVSPVNGLNTVEEYIIRPDYYSEPREIQLGIDLNF